MRSKPGQLFRKAYGPIGSWLVASLGWVILTRIVGEMRWQWVVGEAVVSAICFGCGLLAAQRIIRPEVNALQTQIQELKVRNSEEWDKQRKEALDNHRNKAINKVADALRAEHGFARSESEIQVATGLSLDDVQYALRSLEKTRQVHFSNNNKWSWGPTTKANAAVGWG
jgi:hypothetical protein